MKSKILVVVLFLIIINNTISQDIIIKFDGDTIRGTVTEQTDDFIKYQYPNENLSSSIHQKFLKKIILESGREININRPDQIKLVYGTQMYPRIIITEDINDVKDLFKISDLIVKPKGVKAYKEEAYRQFLRKASMLGASYVLIKKEYKLNYAENSYNIIGECYNHYEHVNDEINNFIIKSQLTLIYSSYAMNNGGGGQNLAKNDKYDFNDDGTLYINGIVSGSFTIENNMLTMTVKRVNKRGKVKESTKQLQVSFSTPNLIVLYDNQGDNSFIETYVFEK